MTGIPTKEDRHRAIYSMAFVAAANQGVTAAAAAAAGNKTIIAADSTRGIKVDAATVAEPFRDQIKARVRQLKEHGIGSYCYECNARKGV